LASGGSAGAEMSAANSPQKGANPKAVTKPDPGNPSHWYLPSDDKGTWAGVKGKSTFTLKRPIEANGRIIDKIQYIDGLPVLDEFELPGKTATVILTADRNADIRHAKIAWMKQNPGIPFPEDATFHHDLLHTTEHIVEIDGKKTKVLVGKMVLVPTAANDAVFHEGSASIARKFYHGLNSDTDAIRKLARHEAETGGQIVAKASKKIVSRTVAKGIRSLVGRNVIRLIPIASTGMAVIEFADNAEAHGFVGAVARATPVLGDLIGAADLASELAGIIVDNANTNLDRTYKEINDPLKEANRRATEQTIQAFKELAPQIKVTNVPISSDDALVSPEAISEALVGYHNEMSSANYMKHLHGAQFDFDTAAKTIKERLRKRLERASQRPKPANGPIG
jgi:hypothetical protein